MTGRTYKQSGFGVLEGIWVCEAVAMSDPKMGDWQNYEIIGGVEPQKRLLYSTPLNAPCTMVNYLLMAREPFGVLTIEGVNGKEYPGRRLTVAKQIHKGQLGRSPDVPRLTVVFDQERDRRNPERHTNGWVRLTELSSLSGLSIREILTEFWPVMDYNWTSYRKPSTHLMYGLPSDIRSGRVQFEERTQAQILQALDDWKSWDDIWIRKGTARSILHLVQFGKRFDPPSVPV